MTSEASIQRVEAQWTSLQLSEVPPSANNLFAHGMLGRFKTPAYKAWLTLAGHEINRQKPPRVAGAYALTLRFGRTRKLMAGTGQLSFRTEHLAEGVTLYQGDCREILPTLGTVDAVVTSPPYDQQREYGGIGDWSLLVPVAMPLVPWHDKTQFLVNLGLIYRDGECIEYWQDLIAEMRNHGFRLFGWYVWDQGDGLPGDWNGRFAPCHEFVFHFNRMARRPNKTFPTKSKGRIITGTGLRKKDGTTNDRMSHDGATVQSTKIPDSVIRIYREMTRDVDHPAIFPTALPHFLAEAFSDAGETILDPFMGSGTTGVACVKLGRKFIGIEIEPKYFDIACRRISEALKQPDMFIERPAPAKQEALL